MTELIIDGVSVELPSEFSVSVKRENPFFTKSGEYTYDIELSLESSVNAHLYHFLNRFNSVEEIEAKRKAVLIADNRVYLSGTEVITGWSEKSVQIQLVSGNSEMNYIADEKTLISSLKMPVTPPRSGSSSIDQKYIEQFYPQIDYCLATVARPDGSKVNDWKWIQKPASGVTGWFEVSQEEYAYVPQVYLCAYLREIIKALGYTLKYNALEDTFAKYIILIHSQKTYSWAQIFPGMTVREFLEMVENTFNVSFKIDFRQKEVAILQNVTYFLQASNAFVSNVVDEYECGCEDEDDDVEVALSTKAFTLSYDFPSSKYYQEAALSQYVKDVALIRDDSYKNGFYSYFKEGDKSTEKLYQIGGYPDIARFEEMIWSDEHHMTGHPSYHYVDFFRQHTEGDGDLQVRMKMIPAEMTLIEGFPIVVAGDTVPRAAEEMKLDDILGMDKKDIGDAGKIRIALYKGLINSFPNDTRKGVPNAFTDFRLNCSGFNHNVNVEPRMSLCPDEMAKTFFTGGYEIDIEHAVRIESFDVNLYDPSSIFVIRNKRFLCKDIEYEIGPNGRKGSWTGTFYPVNLADESTEGRWILADGTWRDNGVWLDDGRWID